MNGVSFIQFIIHLKLLFLLFLENHVFNLKKKKEKKKKEGFEVRCGYSWVKFRVGIGYECLMSIEIWVST